MLKYALRYCGIYWTAFGTYYIFSLLRHWELDFVAAGALSFIIMVISVILDIIFAIVKISYKQNFGK